MSDLKDKLEEVLGAPPKTSAGAERAARAAEALAAYLRLEESVNSWLDSAASTEYKPTGKDDLVGLTLHQAAERVLEGAGTPLHVRELGKRIKAGGWTHKRSKNPRADQINYQLAARLPRHADVFVRVSPNTFGLVKWDRAEGAHRKPRVALYRGSDESLGRKSGEHPDLSARSAKWRSS